MISLADFWPFLTTTTLMLASDILNLDASALSKCLEERSVSAVELMTATLDRIEHRSSDLNAIVSLRPRHDLLQEAYAADNATTTRQQRGWLHGIPMAIKDLSNVKNIPTTYGGSPLFASYIPYVSDPFVQRLVQAGAIVIGKTNAPESGLGSHTYNERFGATTNPYDTSRSAGGSSGGAGVAVAARLLCVADGSDMMGSLRNPAGWNNIYSFRPTAGLLEQYSCPRNPLSHPISTVGPMARNPSDMARLLETMAGVDKFEAPGWATIDGIKEGIEEDPFRILWLGDWAGAYPMEEGICSLCFNTLSNKHAVPNVEVVDGSSQALFSARQLWESWTAIRSAVVAHTGQLVHGKDAVLGETSKVREEEKWEVQRGLLVTDDELEQAGEIEKEWSNAVNCVFESFDAIALPSAQVWPFPVKWKYPESIRNRKMETYHEWMSVVVPVSLAGLPCCTIPAGFSDSGLPMGIQIAGKRNDDKKLFNIAQLYHQAKDWTSARAPEF